MVDWGGKNAEGDAAGSARKGKPPVGVRRFNRTDLRRESWDAERDESP